MEIIMPDGSGRSVDEGSNWLSVAQSIGPRLAKAALAAEVDGVVCDLLAPAVDGAHLRFLTFEDEGGKNALRHTASHILAQAILRLWPDTKLAIGPAIQDGFYYDVDPAVNLAPEDLVKIQKEMAKIVQEDLLLERFELPYEQAIAFMREQGQPYKVELIQGLPEGEAISFYRQGEFVDLCAGPHLPSTGKVKQFKLMSLAGAYWRGDERNKMLQRIYGVAFEKKKDLDEHLFRLEEAKKRDHRKLGRELELFSLTDEGPGFPFFHPRGMVLRNELESFWRQEHAKRGYQEIRTPIMLTKELWERSGHWDNYRENIYTTVIDGQEFCLKPMNCPGGMLVYAKGTHSYRDLPLRVGELGIVHRHELSGALHGLMRVRCFTQDDAHIFMTPDQITDEILGVVDLIRYVYDVFGFKFFIELSTRPEKSIGTDEDWELATNGLVAALAQADLPYILNEGDGAFYGPKIDFHLEDSLGRTWQCGTIQLDMMLPQRFDLTYVGADNERHTPIMIHRVVFGSIERFIGILIEHFAGAFPAWLNPEQVRVLTITDRSLPWAQEVLGALQAAGIRATLDSRNEKIGFKIREAQNMKVNYMLVLGDKEVESQTVAVRGRSKGDLGGMATEAFVQDLLREIREKRVE